MRKGKGENEKNTHKVAGSEKKDIYQSEGRNQKRFWGLHVHVCKYEVLEEAYIQARSNNGSPGIDGVTFGEIEEKGREKFLSSIQRELKNSTYKPTR